MKYSTATALFLGAFILQPTLMNAISVFNASPNLILCLVITLSFLYEDQYCGVIMGTIFGFLMDICYAQYTGISALGYFLVGVAVILVREVLNKENIASAMIVAAGATVAYNLFYWAVMAAFGSGYEFLYWLKFQPFYLLYNIVVVALLYACMIKKVVKYHSDRYYR